MSLKGRSVLVTAGPTREWLDPVRFLSNASSGRMGHALAAAARRRGARVTLVTGPTTLPPPAGVRVATVETARQMLAAALKSLSKADVIIGAAAVADYRPLSRAGGKIKRGAGDVSLRLAPNPDVLATLSRRRKRGAVAVGFALETERLAARARAKMTKKGLDLVVANGPEALNGDRTQALILARDGRAVPFKGTKAGLADKIMSISEGLL